MHRDREAPASVKTTRAARIALRTPPFITIASAIVRTMRRTTLENRNAIDIASHVALLWRNDAHAETR